MIYFNGVATEETKYRVFLHLLTDDLIDAKDEKKDEVFEQMMKEVLFSKHKQKYDSHRHD